MLQGNVRYYITIVIEITRVLILLIHFFNYFSNFLLEVVFVFLCFCLGLACLANIKASYMNPSWKMQTECHISRDIKHYWHQPGAQKDALRDLRVAHHCILLVSEKPFHKSVSTIVRASNFLMEWG